MHWLIIVLAVNAFLGFLLIETVLRSTKRFRTVDEERDSKFPAWRRHDSQMWTRAKLYPGALTIMIPRLIAFASTLVGLWIICRVITIGTSVNAEEPLIGWR